MGSVFPPSDPETGDIGAASLEWTREEMVTMQGPTARFHLSGSAEYMLDGELRMWGAEHIDSDLGDIANLIFRPVFLRPDGGISSIKIEDYPQGWQFIGGNAVDAEASNTYYWTSVAILLLHVGVPDAVRLRITEALKFSMSGSVQEVLMATQVTVNPFVLSLSPVEFINAVTSAVIRPSPFEIQMVSEVEKVATSEVVRLFNAGVLQLSPSGEVIVDLRVIPIESIFFANGAGIW